MNAPWSYQLSRWLLLLALLFAVGCYGRPNPKDKRVPEDKVLDFGKLYGTNCSGCHGQDGNQGPAPPLNDPLFLAIVPDDELRMVISGGRAHSLMTAFGKGKGGSLTTEQVEALIQGLRSTWKAAPDTSNLPPYYAEDAADKGTGAGNATAGAKVFEQTCARCHGKDGLGTREKDGKLGKGKPGPLHDPVFLALISDQALRRIIITGRPDLKTPQGKEAMPDYRHQYEGPNARPLNNQEIADLTALLSSWRKPVYRTEVAGN